VWTFDGMKLERQGLKSKGAGYHLVQAGRREDAVDGAIEVISRDAGSNAKRWIALSASNWHYSR
jgi:hypothetical protein